MKLIIQATLFFIKELIYLIFYLIKKLIYLLIGKEERLSEPDPDDWPPDGSVHFIRLDPPYRSSGLPPNTVQYEFAENVEVSDPVVFTMGREIIFRLCDGRRTLITLTFEPEFPKYLRRKIAMRPVEVVTQFLRSLVPDTSVAQGERVAAVLSNGCPKELFARYKAEPNIHNGFIDFYLFPEENTPTNPKEGLLLVEQGKYQVELYLEYGPPGVNAVLDPEALDIAEVEKVVADVCHAHNILLIDPFDGKSNS